jgi:hypothetical protein
MRILDFQMIPNGFEGYEVSFTMMGRHELKFPIIGFLTHEVLKIVGSYIKTFFFNNCNT